MRLPLLYLIAGCGRIAFDPQGDARDSTPGDVGPPARTCLDAWSTGIPNLSTPVDVTPSDTVGRDHDPTITDDGLTMYFSSARPPSSGDDVWRVTRGSRDAAWGGLEQVTSLGSASGDGSFFTRDNLHGFLSTSRSGGAGGFDLWFAERTATDQPFSMSEMYLENIDTPGTEYDAWVSDDGLRLYHASDGTLNGAARASITASWPAATMLAVQAIPPGSNDPMLTVDERVLLFTIDPGDTIKDIYISHRATTTDAFGPPVRVDAVSEPGVTDFDPFLTADGCELYFASERGRPAGDFGIWMSRVITE